jgi:peptidyl-prolyl cis-trans isomerase SurA
MIKKSVAAVILCCCWVVFCSYGQPTSEKNKGIEIFSVDKKPVLAEEFIYLFRKNNHDKAKEFTEEKINEYLNLLINFKVKVAEARSRGLDTTAAFRKEYNSYREELRKPYLPDSRLIDSLVALTYERMREEVKAVHILINVKPEASPEDTLKAYQKIMGIRNRIIKGEDFETVASTESEDPSAKLNKGNLGYFTAMQMVFPFEQAAYTTKVGSISMPIRSKFGYHIVKVIDRRPARGEVEVSHIMLRTGEGYDNEKAKNTIFDIYEQLQKGVPWNELCKEYSQDPSSKDNGGKLRPFGVGAMPGVPEFEQIAFNLKNPGDLSDPFQTQFGWHIIKLESKIPLPSFNDLAASLKNRVSRDERVQISKQALEVKMRKDFGFTENAEVKNRIFALADTTLQKGKWKVNTPDAANETLFSMQGKPYAAKDFLIYVEQNQKPNSLTSSQYMEQLYNQYLNDVQGKVLEEKIKQQNPDYSWLLNEYYEGILLFEIMEKEVWNKATEDSIGQRSYYQAHRNDYQANERVNAKIYSSTVLSTIRELKSLVEAGDSLKIQEYIASQKIRQEKGAFEKSDRPILTKINWAPGLQLTENNGTHYLVQVTAILPPGIKTFEEARAAVISDFQTDLEKRWIEQLKKRHPVKISKKGKQYILQQLVKN